MRKVDIDWGLLQVHPGGGGGGSLRVGGPGIEPRREGRRRARVGVRVFARYSQAQDFSTRLQGNDLIWFMNTSSLM